MIKLPRYLREYANSLIKFYSKYPEMAEKCERISQMVKYAENGLVTINEAMYCIAIASNESED